jgi:hypothetical protein
MVLNLIQFISIVPITLFIGAILLMLSMYRTKPLDQAFTVAKYKEPLNKTYKEILLYEIEANANSYIKNSKITEKGNRRYSNGVRLTTLAILIAIVLLLSNKLISIETAPKKIETVNGMK